jgi:hypothetical protein
LRPQLGFLSCVSAILLAPAYEHELLTCRGWGWRPRPTSWYSSLRGARDVSNYQELATGLGTLPLLPITAERWQEAARLGFELRVHHGLSFPSADLLIAAVAIAHDATLIHRDSDFDLIAKHTALRVESYTYLGYS